MRLHGLSAVGAEPARLRLTVRRVDASHANLAAAWTALGRPDTLTREQVAALRTASELRPEDRGLGAADETGSLTVVARLAPAGVVLLELALA